MGLGGKLLEQRARRFSWDLVLVLFAGQWAFTNVPKKMTARFESPIRLILHFFDGLGLGTTPSVLRSPPGSVPASSWVSFRGRYHQYRRSTALCWAYGSFWPAPSCCGFRHGNLPTDPFFDQVEVLGIIQMYPDTSVLGPCALKDFPASFRHRGQRWRVDIQF